MKIDTRSKEDILNEIGELAESYVPQWSYRGENKDAGTALAQVFSEMLYDTKEKYNLLFRKYEIDFFNRLHAKMLPARAATGYVTFGLASEEVGAVEVMAGTRVLAQTENGEVPFELLEPVLVSPAGIEEIYQVFGQQDYIKREKAENGNWSIHAFKADRENLQKHEIYLCHSRLFEIGGRGQIEIKFQKNPYEAIPGEIAERLTDREIASIGYYSEEGFCEFEQMEAREGSLLLTKGSTQSGFRKKTIEGIHNYWIGIRMKEASAFWGVKYESIRLRSHADELLPDAIHGGGMQCEPVEYYPFGKKMGMFQEVVFGSLEALGKKRARVRLCFGLEFERIPLETNRDHKINWKWKMKEKDFEKEPEYDISIAEVIWEYYSETGWRRLFQDGSHKDIFCYKEGASKAMKEIDFRVPEDIREVVINSVSSCYIRARILQMNNEYKTNGYYVPPILSETTFDFYYEDKEILPENIIHSDNGEVYLVSGNAVNFRFFIKPMEGEHRAIYMGFRIPPTGSPLKMLFSLEKSSEKSHYPLKWEYYSKQGFREMNVTDETQHFRKTGMITFTGENDFQKKSFFAKELYWIRITDVHDYYTEESTCFPHIHGIYQNAARAMACKSVERQLFRISRYEVGKKLMLSKGELLSIDLWVDEGKEEERWVRWENVPDFLDSRPSDRHYTTDAYKGIVTFGDGVHGMAAPPSDHNNVRVEFRTGGGLNTNVKPGQICKLERSIGFISRVSNPFHFKGGCERETMEEAIERTSAALKHRHKAVTIQDYEEIAEECSHVIHKVTCFPHVDGEGNEKPGALTLCVIQKDYETGYLYFEELKNRIFTFLKDKIGQSIINEQLLYITAPVPVKVCIDLQAHTDSFDNVLWVKEEITKRLAAFLNPLTGNSHGKGFAIGEVPDLMQIRNEVYSVSRISGIRRMELSYRIVRGGWEEEADIETVKALPYILIAEGVLGISVGVKGGGRDVADTQLRY